jgi:RNA polymerase sigma-70 factor (ECF subfamily)
MDYGDQQPSRALLRRMRDGDGAALEELLTQHLDRLHGFLRLRCGPALRAHESSLDVVQSVCRQVLADAGRFEYRGEPAFRNWLFQVAENKVRDHLRRFGRAKRDAGRVVELDASAESAVACYASICSPSAGAIAREQMERIERAFDELDDEYRRVILLSRVVGLEHAEIAAEIGQTPHYTRTLLSRALARLSTLLDRA